MEGLHQSSRDDDIPIPDPPSPRVAQTRAIQQLRVLYEGTFLTSSSSLPSSQIRRHLKSLRPNVVNADAPPPGDNVLQLFADLERHATEAEADENDSDEEAAINTNTPGASIPSMTPVEIENEVDRRLRRSSSLDRGPLNADDTYELRKGSRRYLLAIETRYNNHWPLGSLPEQAQEYYRAPWRADSNFGYGLRPQQSPFADLLSSADTYKQEYAGIWARTRAFDPKGEVTLWQMNRQNGGLLKVVVKEAKENPFYKDYGSEANLMLRLNAVGCKNALTVLDWRQFPMAEKFRLCLEYAEHGDIYKLWGWYYSKTLIFPEAFIWHILSSLASALLYCLHGNTEGSSLDGWEEIINGDMKPENTFLSAPDDVEHKLYPCVKLADFGHAYTVPSKDVRRFKSYAPLGTRGYQAPEIVNGENKRNKPEVFARNHPDPSARRSNAEDPGTHSDIWSLGSIIDRLMRLVNKHISIYSTKELLKRRLRRGYYSRVLTGLVERCLDPDHNSRITALELYQITSKYAAKHKEKSYQAAENATPSRPCFLEQVLFKEEDQQRYDHDESFRLEYDNANLSALDELNNCFRVENPRDEQVFPNELLTPPTYINVNDFFRAGMLSRSPSPNALEDPYQWPHFRTANSRHHTLAPNLSIEAHQDHTTQTSSSDDLPAQRISAREQRSEAQQEHTTQAARSYNPPSQRLAADTRSYQPSNLVGSVPSIPSERTGPFTIEPLGGIQSIREGSNEGISTVGQPETTSVATNAQLHESPPLDDNTSQRVQPQQHSPGDDEEVRRHSEMVGPSTSSPLSDAPPSPILHPSPADQMRRHSGLAGSSTSSPLSDVPPGPILHPFPADEASALNAPRQEATSTGVPARNTTSQAPTASYSSNTTISSGPSQRDDEENDPTYQVGAKTRNKYVAQAAAQANDPAERAKQQRRTTRPARQAGLKKQADARQQKEQRKTQRARRRGQTQGTEVTGNEEDRTTKAQRQADERDERARKRRRL